MDESPQNTVAWWAVTRVMSPRGTVRIAARDAYGAVINAYPAQHLVSARAPRVPWAIYLTDDQGHYRWIAFDFDAAKGNPDEDAKALTALLDEVGIVSLRCASSGEAGSGIHVWLSCDTGVTAMMVQTLARIASAALASLDIAPLMNVATGCVRPPGAPHRRGGRSTPACPIEGVRTFIAQRTATPQRLDRLIRTLSERITQPELPEQPALLTSHGPLSEHTATLLASPVPFEADASRVLWQIALGVARAGWDFAHFEQLATQPGMEAARTRRGNHQRIPRPLHGANSTHRVLKRTWAKAQQRIHQLPHHASQRETAWIRQTRDQLAVVDELTQRADASPQRWICGGGPADRRVLDCLMTWSLHATHPVIAADIRRIATTCAISRETARRALHRLAHDGWIRPHTPGIGRKAASWVVESPVTTKGVSQVRSTPAPYIPAVRLAMMRHLDDRLARLHHDAFAPTALGILAGNLYAGLCPAPTTRDCRYFKGLWVDLVDRHLVGGKAGIDCTETLDQIAVGYGVKGVLARRDWVYRAERHVWRWWQAELVWLRSPKPMHRIIVAGESRDVRIWPRRGEWRAYPRKHGRPDHARAKELILSQQAADLIVVELDAHPIAA